MSGCPAPPLLRRAEGLSDEEWARELAEARAERLTAERRGEPVDEAGVWAGRILESVRLDTRRARARAAVVAAEARGARAPRWARRRLGAHGRESRGSWAAQASTLAEAERAEGLLIRAVGVLSGRAR